MADPDPDSILTSVKKALGLSQDYVVFDPEIIMHINSVFGDLNQLGIGPDDGFAITDDSAVWADFSTVVQQNALKSYTYLRVRILFDPPSTAALLAAYQMEVSRWEFRLNVQREGTQWVPPTT